MNPLSGKVAIGVARNRAEIVFPARIRWGRRAYRLFPAAIERQLLRQWRALRGYRAAESAS